MQTCQRAALSVICFANASSPKGRAEKPVRTAHLTNQSKPHANLFACCSFRHGLRRATFLREEGFGFPHSPTCLSLWERCRAATERAGSLFEGAGLPPCGKPEGVLQIGKIRMRFALMQTCQRAALSVICFANASSPKGRAEKPVRTFSSYAQTKPVSPFGRDVAQRQRGQAPSLREPDCRLAARLREQLIICHA